MIQRLLAEGLLPISNSWEVERQIRHDEGLCFRCGEKFGPGHRCKMTMKFYLGGKKCKLQGIAPRIVTKAAFQSCSTSLAEEENYMLTVDPNPIFHLEDKVDFSRGVLIRFKPWKIY